MRRMREWEWCRAVREREEAVGRVLVETTATPSAISSRFKTRNKREIERAAS